MEEEIKSQQIAKQTYSYQTNETAIEMFPYISQSNTFGTDWFIKSNYHSLRFTL